MNTAGIDSFSSLLSGGDATRLSQQAEVGAPKIDKLMHLLANLSQPVLLLSEDEALKTAAFRQFQSKAHDAWTVCYIGCTANLSFERIVDEMLQALRRPGTAWSDGTLEALFDEQHTALRAQGRHLILLLDDAGILMPGLLGAVCQFARTHSALHLAYSLTAAEMQEKSRTDALAVGYSYVLDVFASEHKHEAAELKPADWSAFKLNQEAPVVTPEESRRISRVLLLLGILLAALIAVAVSFYLRPPVLPVAATAAPKLAIAKPEISTPPVVEIEKQPVVLNEKPLEKGLPEPVKVAPVELPSEAVKPAAVELKKPSEEVKPAPVESKKPPVEPKVDRFEIEKVMDNLIWKLPAKQAVSESAPAPKRAVETAPAIKEPPVQNQPQPIVKEIKPEPKPVQTQSRTIEIKPEPKVEVSVTPQAAVNPPENPGVAAGADAGKLVSQEPTPELFASMIKRIEEPHQALSAQMIQAPASLPVVPAPVQVAVEPQKLQTAPVEAASKPAVVIAPIEAARPLPEAAKTVLPVVPAPVQAAPEPQKPQANQTAQVNNGLLDQQLIEGVNDIGWLLQQDPQAYTLQLVTVSRLNALSKLTGKFPPGTLATYRTSRNVYPVLYGVYPSLAEAQFAVQSLPMKLGTPIPRQFKAIHQEIQKMTR